MEREFGLVQGLQRQTGVSNAEALPPYLLTYLPTPTYMMASGSQEGYLELLWGQYLPSRSLPGLLRPA